MTEPTAEPAPKTLADVLRDIVNSGAVYRSEVSQLEALAVIDAAYPVVDASEEDAAPAPAEEPQVDDTGTADPSA